MSWRALNQEFARWDFAGKSVNLWWRDDDAREPSPALDRLLEISSRWRAPLTLAVIPDGEREVLANLVNPEKLVSVAQHGVSHQLLGPGLGEFSLNADPVSLAAAISEAGRRLGAFYARKPIFVPPWNVVQPNLVRALRVAGFTAVSAYADAQLNLNGLARVDAHLDLLRWKAAPRFQGRSRLLRRLLELMRARRKSGAWEQPIGILTHHLQNDQDAWRFLDELLKHTASVDVHWRQIDELLPAAPSRASGRVAFSEADGAIA